MEKKFFQRGISFALCIIVAVGVLLLGLGLGIYGIIIRNWLILIITLCPIVLGLYGAIQVLGYHIHFQTERIFTTGDVVLPKTEKIQNKVEIFYRDIKDVRLIYSSTNSKDKYISRSLGPNTYFEFSLHDDKKARLLILNHSKKQRREMISIINEKTGLNFDYDKMKAESHPPNERVLNWFRGFKKSDQKEDALGNRKSRRLVKSKRRVKRKKPTEKVK